MRARTPQGVEFVEEERAARHISINILLYRPGNAGTADNEHRTHPEVFEAVNAEADVLDGLYKTVITLTDRIGIAVPPRIVDVRKVVANGLHSSGDCVRCRFAKDEQPRVEILHLRFEVIIRVKNLVIVLKHGVSVL